MMSLRTRVSLGAALVLAVFLALAALALERAFEESAGSAMRERLFAQLYLVMAAAEVDSGGRLSMPETLGEPRLNLPDSGLYARVGSPSGETLWLSPSAVGLNLDEVHDLAIGEEGLQRRRLGEDEFFLAHLAVEWEAAGERHPLVFSVVEDTTPFTEQLVRYRTNLWGWFGAMAALLLVVLAGVLAWGLRPLRTVASELAAIEAGEAESLHQDYPKELRRLTDNINALLHHERAQRARYKNALSDLAHSLKTPLAVLRGLGAQPATTEQLQVLQQQVTHMDNIVQYQLQRAAAAGHSALAAPLAVAPVAERILATLQKVYRDKPLRLECVLEEAALFRGDEGDLMELLGNLLDNAYKWCRSKVRLCTRQSGGMLLLLVEDDGPGIGAEQAESAQRRGVRLDESIPGHGIGLALVRDIVEAYQGRLEIDRSELGGALIKISLPVA